MEKNISFLRKMICLPIKIYRGAISPFLPPSCRFYPSCSQYAILAITTFGVMKGLKLACCRVLRCHPWADGGYDPVFPTDEKL